MKVLKGVGIVAITMAAYCAVVYPICAVYAKKQIKAIQDITKS